MRIASMVITATIAAGAIIMVPGSNVAEASAAQLRMGSEVTLTSAQEVFLDERWGAAEQSGKIICTSLHSAGANFENRVIARKQAKAACTYLGEKYGSDFYFQAKPTEVASMVGAVFIRTHKPQVFEPQTGTEASSESSSVSISKTIALPEMNFSSSSTVSREIVDVANERLSSIEGVAEIVCTAVVGENWDASRIALSLLKAKSLCLSLSTEGTVTTRFQTKISKSAWAGRLMLTTVSQSERSTTPSQERSASESQPVQPSRPKPTQPPRSPSAQETAPGSSSPNRSPQNSAPGETEENEGSNQETLPEPEPITVDISGTAVPGQLLTAAFSNVPTGATVTCIWHDSRDSVSREVLGSSCSISVPDGTALYFSATVSQGGAELFSVSDRQICDLCVSPEPEDPTMEIVGERYVGNTLRIVVSPLPEGSTVVCSWESNGSYNNTIYSNSCNFTPNRQITGAIFVRAIATIPGKPGWSSGFVSVGKIMYRPISPTPSLVVSGERFVGETLTASVGPLPPGASLSCTWESRGIYNSTTFGRSCSFALDKRYGNETLWVRAVVSLPNHSDWSSGYVNIGSIGYRQFSSTPELNLTGTLRVGETITAEIANQPEGSSVSCEWYTLGYNGPIVKATSCSVPMTLSLATTANGAQGLFLKVSVGKSGYDSWRTTRQIPNVELLVFNPTFEVIGDRTVGSTLVASVTNIPDGSVVSCRWSRKNPRGANVSRVEYSTACELTITDELKRSINLYSWGMDVQVTVNKADYPQWSRLQSGIFIQ